MPKEKTDTITTFKTTKKERKNLEMAALQMGIGLSEYIRLLLSKDWKRIKKLIQYYFLFDTGNTMCYFIIATTNKENTMYDDTPTAAELAEDEKAECPDCGCKMDSSISSSNFWGVIAMHAQQSCPECGYTEEV